MEKTVEAFLQSQRCKDRKSCRICRADEPPAKAFRRRFTGSPDLFECPYGVTADDLEPHVARSKATTARDTDGGPRASTTLQAKPRRARVARREAVTKAQWSAAKYIGNSAVNKSVYLDVPEGDSFTDADLGEVISALCTVRITARFLFLRLPAHILQSFEDILDPAPGLTIEPMRTEYTIRWSDVLAARGDKPLAGVLAAMFLDVYGSAEQTIPTPKPPVFLLQPDALMSRVTPGEYWVLEVENAGAGKYAVSAAVWRQLMDAHTDVTWVLIGGGPNNIEIPKGGNVLDMRGKLTRQALLGVLRYATGGVVYDGFIGYGAWSEQLPVILLSSYSVTGVRKSIRADIEVALGASTSDTVTALMGGFKVIRDMTDSAAAASAAHDGSGVTSALTHGVTCILDLRRPLSVLKAEQDNIKKVCTTVATALVVVTLDTDDEVTDWVRQNLAMGTVIRLGESASTYEVLLRCSRSVETHWCMFLSRDVELTTARWAKALFNMCMRRGASPALSGRLSQIDLTDEALHRFIHAPWFTGAHFLGDTTTGEAWRINTVDLSILAVPTQILVSILMWASGFPDAENWVRAGLPTAALQRGGKLGHTSAELLGVTVTEQGPDVQLPGEVVGTLEVAAMGYTFLSTAALAGNRQLLLSMFPSLREEETHITDVVNRVERARKKLENPRGCAECKKSTLLRQISRDVDEVASTIFRRVLEGTPDQRRQLFAWARDMINPDLKVLYAQTGGVIYALADGEVVESQYPMPADVLPKTAAETTEHDICVVVDTRGLKVLDARQMLDPMEALLNSDEVDVQQSTTGTATLHLRTTAPTIVWLGGGARATSSRLIASVANHVRHAQAPVYLGGEIKESPVPQAVAELIMAQPWFTGVPFFDEKTFTMRTVDPAFLFFARELVASGVEGLTDENMAFLLPAKCLQMGGVLLNAPPARLGVQVTTSPDQPHPDPLWTQSGSEGLESCF